MAGERWIFTKEQLSDTPSRKAGINGDTELSYRQQAANFIQDMGQRLQVTQLCINTAIVYMHRFYMFHSFKRFHRNQIAAACLFLAAKVEEQPRKLEHVIKVAHLCLHRETGTPTLDTKSDAYLEQAQELVCNENILLQTLGFDFTVDHPHTHVVKTCQLVRASKDLAQTSYFLATNSLHLTSMCLQYRPTVVACVCIHLACKWSSWEFPKSNEGKDWWVYVDKLVTLPLLEELTADFLTTLDHCPSKLKKKILSYKSAGKEAAAANIKDEKPQPPVQVKKERPNLTSPVKKEKHAAVAAAATLSSTNSAAQSISRSASASNLHPSNHEHNRRSDARYAGHHRSADVREQAHHGGTAGISPAGTPTLGKHKDPTAGAGTPIDQLKRVKSESTLTPKEYLMRREREKKAIAAASIRHSESAASLSKYVAGSAELHHSDLRNMHMKEQKHSATLAENSSGYVQHIQQRDSGATEGWSSHTGDNYVMNRADASQMPHQAGVRDATGRHYVKTEPQHRNDGNVKKPEHPHLKIKIPKDKSAESGSLRIKIPTEHVKAEQSRHREKHKHKSEKTPPSSRRSHSSHEKNTSSEDSPQPIKLKLSLSGMSSKSSKKQKEKELKSPTKPLTIKIKDMPPMPDKQNSHGKHSSSSNQGDYTKMRHHTPDKSQHRKRVHSPPTAAMHVSATSHTTPSPQPPSSKLARNDSFSKLQLSVDNLHNMPPPHIDPFMQNVPDVIFEGDMDLDEENGSDEGDGNEPMTPANINSVQRQLEQLIELQKASIANSQQSYHHSPMMGEYLHPLGQPPLPPPPMPPQHALNYMYAPPPPPPPE